MTSASRSRSAIGSASRAGSCATVAERRGSALIGWVKRHVSREAFARNRFLRPVAHRVLAPSLWRFNRRSVPRGVALGIVTGILFPFAHMLVAAVLSVPARANVPTAVATTLLNNPLTIPPLWVAAYRIGRWVLRLDASVPGRPIASNVTQHADWLHWLVAQGGPATIVGLVIIAAVLSVIGYGVTALGWRLWIRRKWQTRHR
ncbi:DUF2062 domain-containing protein [Sphingomonas koreensis]|nr:DUF2062 domain-containing protein [Sphingomonas koreensis]